MRDQLIILNKEIDVQSKIVDLGSIGLVRSIRSLSAVVGQLLAAVEDLAAWHEIDAQQGQRGDVHED